MLTNDTEHSEDGKNAQHRVLQHIYLFIINHEDNKRNSHDDGDDDNDYDDNFSCTCVAKMRTTKATVMATAMATIVPECNLIISDRTMWVEYTQQYWVST